MDNFEQKPKRKRTGRNPYLFLVAGIVIGIIVAAILGVVALVFVGNSSQVQEPIITISTPSPIAPTSIGATAVPIEAQGVQATPIANRIQAAAISANGNYLAYVSVEDGVSHIYLNELRVESNLTGNQYDLYNSQGYFNDIVFSPDGSKLIATIDSGFAVLFDVQSRELIADFAQIGGAAFSSNGDRLVLVGRNNGIRVLDMTDENQSLLASRLNGDTSYMVGAVTVSRGNDLAIALDERIEIYDLNNLDTAPQIVNPNGGFVFDLAFHPTDATRLAVALAGSSPQDGLVQVYDLSNTSRSQFNFGTRVFALAFSPEGEWLAVGGGETGYGESKLIAFRWDSNNNPIPADPTFHQPLSFEGHEHSIFDVAFTREGYLLSASWDGSVRLWDLFSDNNALSVYYP